MNGPTRGINKIIENFYISTVLLVLSTRLQRDSEICTKQLLGM